MGKLHRIPLFMIFACASFASVSAAEAPHDVAYTGDKPAGNILINIGARKLYYVEDKDTVRVYEVAVGSQKHKSPTGTFNITAKRVNPTWAPTANMRAQNPKLKAVKGGSKSNPLGARALNLGNTYYRIHGTNAPSTIGQAVSHGCYRMTNPDVIELFDKVHIGTKVTIISGGETPGIAAVKPKTEAPKKPKAP